MAKPHQPRTWDDKYTMAEWWQMVKEAQEERHKIDLFKPLMNAGDLVFDIGANRGMLTVIFRSLGARVVAVEPLFSIGPQFVREFAWKFGNDEMVIPVTKAVSPRPRMLIWIHVKMPYLSSGSSMWMRKSAHKKYYKRKNTAPKWVKTTTLDALIREYGMPAFAKVDVEGAENSVLRTLSRPVPALSMEFHEDWIPKAAMEKLTSLADYEWNYALNQTGAYVLPEWGTVKEMRAYMRTHLTRFGPLSWGDIYCRRI